MSEEKQSNDLEPAEGENQEISGSGPPLGEDEVQPLDSEEVGATDEEPEEPDEMTLVQEQLEEALREKDQFRTLAQRAQADLVNYRRRAVDEIDETRRAANSGLLLKLLSVVDDLDRAMEVMPQDAVAPGWLEGLELVRRNLDNILVSEGVSKIDAEGKIFEPWEHEAVFYEESEETEEGMVVRVIRQGYKLHDRVLRAAQVSVSRAAEKQQSESTEQEAT